MIDQQFVLYRKRFFIAFVVAMANIANATQWSSFGSITPSSEKYYQVSSFAINFLSIIYFILFVLISPVSSWVLDTKGTRTSIFVGVFLTFLGSVVRVVGDFTGGITKYVFCFIGQVLSGSGQPFLLDAPTKVCALWFGPNERTMANSVMSLAQTLGSIIALALGPGIISDSDPNTFLYYNLIILGISFIPVIPAFWVEDKPKTPPSHSADIVPITFKEGLKQLFSTRQFVYLFVIITAMLGMFNAYITLISNYVTPFGYSESDAGNLGVVTVVVGIVSAAVIGPYLDYSKNHAIVLRVCCFVTTVGAVFCFIGCQPNNLYLWYIGSTLFGLGGFPIVPMVLELGVEVTFPIDEGTSAGFLLLGGNAGGIFFLFVSNALSFDGNLKYGVLLLVIGAGIAAVTSIFFKNENRRHKEDITIEEVKVPEVAQVEA